MQSVNSDVMFATERCVTCQRNVCNNVAFALTHHTTSRRDLLKHLPHLEIRGYAAASSWSAKTIEGGSNSFSKAVTDFNKQFKPQMEVAEDVVGPTWDRAEEIAKPVTAPQRDARLG